MEAFVVITVVLLRFFVPLLIPRFPLPAILACLVLDAADQTIFQSLGLDPPGYQTYDKALDVYYLAIAYFSTMRNWRDPVAFRVAQFLYIYRLIGVTAFELAEARWLLLVFPNTFEYFFIAYEFVRTKWNPRRLSARAIVGIAAFIWIVIKLPQEWWIHVAKLDFTDFMADHPYMWGVLTALVVIALGALYVFRGRIPAADWPFTMRVEDHLEPIADTAERERFFSGVLLEKVVIMGLITVIFAQVLPEIESTTAGLFIGATILVVLNAAVSQFLRLRGRTWTAAGETFLITLAINVGIVTLDRVIGVRDSADAPAVNTLFFVLLLSTLISLFDRFRATRVGIDAGPGVLASMRAEHDQPDADTPPTTSTS